MNRWLQPAALVSSSAGMVLIATAVSITSGVFTTGDVLAQPDGESRDDDFAITLESPSQIDSGASVQFKIAIAPKAGLRLSSDGPVSISIAATPAVGLRFDRKRWRRKDAVDPAASPLRFSISARSEKPEKTEAPDGAEAVRDGEKATVYQVAFDIRFWVCGAKTCRPVRERRQVELEVRPGKPAPTDETANE